MKRLLILALIFASCENVKLVTTDPPTGSETNTGLEEKVKLPAFDVQGHRGSRGLMPENTIPGFLKALDLGVNTLKMDMAITKDDQVIVSHDPYFDYQITQKPDGTPLTEAEQKNSNIYQMTYEEVKKYDVGIRGQKWYPEQKKIAAVKPLLSNVIDSVEAHSKQAGRALPFYNIDMKSIPAFDNVYFPQVEKFVTLVMGVLSQKGIEKRVVISSIDTRVLKYLHHKYPSIRVGLNVSSDDGKTFTNHMDELGFTPAVYSLDYKDVTEQLIADARQKNVRIIPFTVNEVADMKRLKAMGVSGFMTDYPNRAQRAFESSYSPSN